MLQSCGLAISLKQASKSCHGPIRQMFLDMLSCQA